MIHKYDPDCPFCEEKPLTPEMLVEKMVEAQYENKYNRTRWIDATETTKSVCIDDAKVALKKVLQAIKDGEVVDANGRCFAELTPSFSKFLEGA